VKKNWGAKEDLYEVFHSSRVVPTLSVVLIEQKSYKHVFLTVGRKAREEVRGAFVFHRSHSALYGDENKYMKWNYNWGITPIFTNKQIGANKKMKVIYMFFFSISFQCHGDGALDLFSLSKF
jgi:hypothetical protein